MNELSWFNQQILKCQDDAYTLAWYLLGDESAAEAAVQKALISLFAQNKARDKDCRIYILRSVLQQCQNQTRLSFKMTGAPLHREFDELLHKLPARDRQTLVLVDVIGLSYEEAADVTGLPVKTFRQRLAQARLSLTASQQAQSV